MRFVSADFDEFTSTLAGVDCRYLLKSRITQPWQLDTLVFGRTTYAVGRDGGSAIFQGALKDAYALIIGLANTGSYVVNGDRLYGEQIIWLPPMHELHASMADDVHWLTVMVDRAEVESWVASDEIRLHPRFLDHCSGRTASMAVSRTTALVMRAIELAETTPRIQPQGSGLDYQLTDAVLAILQNLRPTPRVREGRPPVNGRLILREVVHLMEERPDGMNHISDYCAAVGVSATTLRKVFHEMLDVSPQRYLQTRRLHAIRSALKQAGPHDTVSSICGEFGIWDFGRFAGEFRQLFGVLPSSMLKRDS